MDQKDRLDRLAGRIVELDEIFERVRADNRGAGREAEGILEVTAHDFVADSDIDDIGQVVARSGLRRSEADRACEAANDGADIFRRHALDFARAALRSRARVAEIGLDIGAAERFDAAGVVDRLDREFGAEPAGLTVGGKRAGQRLQDSNLDARRLGSKDDRRGQRANRGGSDLESPSARDSWNSFGQS